MSNFFYEPFYTLSDFDRLFDEAFNARTNAGSGNNQVARQGSENRALRPRYLLSHSFSRHELLADRCSLGWMFTKTIRTTP